MNLEESVPQIKRLVASAIPGLSIEKVSVVLVPAAAPTRPEAAPKSVTPPASPMMMVAYVLTALSLLCVAGFAAWRMIAQRRSVSAQTDMEAEAA